MFDKKEYWKRRKEGKRGQGDEVVPAGRLIRYVTRKASRQKVASDPRFTKRTSKQKTEEERAVTRAKVLAREAIAKQHAERRK